MPPRSGSFKRIDIDEDWAVSADSHQWILERRRVPEKVNEETGEVTYGDPYYAPEGYYKSLSTLVSALFKRNVRSTEAENLKELAERIDEIAAALEAKCDDIRREHLSVCL